MSLDVMKQALEALEMVTVDVKTTPNAYEASRQAITALRAAIKDQETQAENLLKRMPVRGTLLEQTLGKVWDEMPHPDYQKEMEREPVAWMHPSWIDPDTRGWESDSFNAIPIEGWVPVYTAPRQWQGLADEEIVGASCECVDDGTFNMNCAVEFARAIEAKLKEKNNG